MLYNIIIFAEEELVMNIWVRIFGDKNKRIAEQAEDDSTKVLLKLQRQWDKRQPVCKTCGISNDKIHAAHKAKGIIPIGLGIGICPRCRSTFCNTHSVASNDGWTNNKCPLCKIELDFYWDKKPSDKEPWRLGPRPK
jgi:hypothetical protein